MTARPGRAIVTVALRLPRHDLRNGHLVATPTFRIALLPALPVLHLCARVSRDMGGTLIEMGMAWDASSQVGFMKSHIRTMSVFALAVSSTAALAEELTVNDIVALTEMQLGDAAIIAKIEAESASFDLSTEQMIALKQKGVSSNVIAAMVRSGQPDTAVELSVDSPDPMVPHSPGVYVLHGTKENGRMERLEPTSSSQMKTGGIWGYALTGGLASASMKVSIPNATARIQTTTKPYFYFFFDESQKGATANSFMGSTFLASSPADFTLVRLDKKKGRREARVGSMNIGGAKMGVMDKDRIPIDYEPVRPGVYKIKAGQILTPGEYGFLYSLPGAGVSGAASARIFDFSVK